MLGRKNESHRRHPGAAAILSLWLAHRSRWVVRTAIRAIARSRRASGFQNLRRPLRVNARLQRLNRGHELDPLAPLTRRAIDPRFVIAVTVGCSRAGSRPSATRISRSPTGWSRPTG